MSAASGKLSSSRFPLSEHSLNNDSSNLKITDTPISYKSNYKSKMTTPPESIFTNRKRPLNFETPISKHMNLQTNLVHDPTNVNLDPTILSANSMMSPLSKSLLLSPAFSSPSQQYLQQHHHHQQSQPQTSVLSYNQNLKPPSYINPTTSSLSLTSDDKPSSPSSAANTSTTTTSTSTTTKKVKKSKPAKETAFDLQSEDKPPYSYATLIGISILSHEEKRLTLSSIYQWISDTFKYYKREDVGWQNSIRHNLSLNKAFIKGDKSKDGKGHFWLIKPGCEEQFLKSRSVKKSSYHEVMDQIKSANHNWNRDDTKRSMNAIPSSPDISHDYTTNTANDHESNRASKRRKVSEIDKSANYDSHIYDDNDEDNGEYDYTYVDDENDSNISKSKIEDNDEDDEEVKDDFDDEGDVTTQLVPSGKRNHKNDPYYNITKTPNANSHAPTFVVTESPDKPLLAGKNLTYTSSFSCNSNLELSPVRPSETGPLLEPLTPANNIYQKQKQQQQLLLPLTQNTPSITTTTTITASASIASTHHNLQALSQLSNIPVLYQRPSLINNHISQIQPPNHLTTASTTTVSTSNTTNTHSSNNMLQKTPKSNIIRTPLRNLRTPQSNSIMKKLWNSPSYLDDFYYSPLINNQTNNSTINSASRTFHHSLTSYDDDDMILRNYEHHQSHMTSSNVSASSPLLRRSNSVSTISIDSSRNLFNDFKKMETSNPEAKPTDRSSPSTEPDEEN